ncbi:RES family NAD+ phosphorylase [Cereibacter sphaeroides]|uniref:RES family NAD+ phosphorylase n=1 Tax=Cereibacter sphaeroides TaxID=1063 RepID=UPI001F236C8E|nr:RES family NAD+ phosphorylase [Cereibacter sphaeroides]MCE6959170.1 RES family NAD+ phosphorylase [Cereibacter sphaeroides]MCE6968411.1 RES family NAD+ phosphorylase [Cereibacter sphaeroides]MCE6974169.1 RES family NAD+ phosphorylase [Cereibacter sphaeroides]
MPKFPEPPPAAVLTALGPEIRVLATATPLARIFLRGGDHPVDWNSFRHWGPGSGRFDHHLPDGTGAAHVQDRGILYAAGAVAPGALAVCAAEVFQETRIIDTGGRHPWFAVFRTRRPLHLLDLTGLWPTRAGASAAIASGPKARARRWSRAFHAAFPGIDGLLYASSMGGNAPAVALYERAADSLPDAPDFHRALADPALRVPLLHAAAAIRYLLA